MGLGISGPMSFPGGRVSLVPGPFWSSGEVGYSGEGIGYPGEGVGYPGEG